MLNESTTIDVGNFHDKLGQLRELVKLKIKQVNEAKEIKEMIVRELDKFLEDLDTVSKTKKEKIVENGFENF